jgi:hypothetical protein
VLKKVLTASLLCGLFVWQGAAAPEGDARKAKWAERLKTDEAKGRVDEAASTAEEARPVTSAPAGITKKWLQERWDGQPQKSWNGKDSYWYRTDVDIEFMPPYIGAAYGWAARRELAMAEGSRFAVSSLATKTSILYGGVGTGENSDTGVVCYAEDREGANWKVSPVKERGGFAAEEVFDVCWTPKPQSGSIFTATRMGAVSTNKTPLFYQRGVVPTSTWDSVLESPLIPPRTVYEFSAVAPEPAGTSPEVYLGYSGASIGTGQLYNYREQPPLWKDIGKLAYARYVHSLCTTGTGFLAGTGPKGYVYEWIKNTGKLNPKRVGALADGDINDITKIGDYYYAAAGNCSPGDKARLFRTKDLAQWEDVTPRATGVSSLNGFVAVAAFGKDGAVAAVGDTFDRLYVSSYPAPANWGVIAGDAGAVARDLAHVAAGSDFWGNFVAYKKEGSVYTRKFQGFKSGGVLYSSVYDSYDKLIQYTKLDVEGPMASGSAKFWLRAAHSEGDFKTAEGGPGEPAWVSVTPGQPLPIELDNKRFVQYKVQLDVPDAQKFPPVVKKAELAMLSTYSKVTGTTPANGTKGHNVDVPIKFIFSKDIRRETVTEENIIITGKNRTYRWYFDRYDENTCEYVVAHQDFEAYDDITVTLESIPRREILDKDGWDIDPDGDGEPLGKYQFTFSAGAGGGGEGEGPRVYNLTVKPNPTFGAVKIEITATADDTETGNSPIAAAEYSFGASPAPAGAGEPMEGDFGTPKTDVWAEADISEISKGEKRLTVYVRAMDKRGNWGDPTATPIFIRPPAFLPAEYVYFYPNPCRDEVGYFHYLVTQNSEISVRIYDIRGRLVEEIKATAAAYSGERGLRWDVSRVGADVYIFQFTARGLATGEVATVTKKLAVLK